MGSTGDVRQQIIQAAHNSGVGGHSGIFSTFKRVSQHFYWPELRKDVKTNVSECDVSEDESGACTIPWNVAATINT